MRATKSAFTLVEILIVVIILGILAGIIISNITGVTAISRETNLKENLSKVRAQIQVYRQKHASLPQADDFVDQMTKYTDFEGHVADTPSNEYRYGPYLEQMPPNPITMDATVRAAADPAQRRPPGDQDGGWWYNETTGDFYADLSDTYVDDDGNPYNRF